MNGVKQGLRRLISSPYLLFFAVAALLFATYDLTLSEPVKPSAIAKVAEERGVAAMLLPSRSSLPPASPHRPQQLSSVSPPSQPANGQPRIDCDSRPCIALSFDDGPDSKVTPQVLRILEKKHASASFFLIGNKVQKRQALVQRMVEDRFEVGNHSWSHADFTKLNPQQIRSDLLTAQAEIVLAGAPKPTMFRPPYGSVSQKVVRDIGLQVALWNIDPEDWLADDPKTLTKTIVASARPGGVIDLHDTHQITADVLPKVIDMLKAKNYRFVTVSELLHSRGRPGQEPFYGYAADSYHFHP
jgi:peptidoglycan/xylan/chitin deacetylase (PgdA/CDA1 family)